MALREYRIGQTWLVPKRVTDFIPENHVCYFIANIAENVNFEKINQKYRHTKGEPAYSRRMLLRMVLMASVDGVFSSRRIARLAEENVVYMYLSGMDKPDFRTICRFKIECNKEIEEAFKMTIKVAHKMGMVKLNHVAIDGTKLKANASNANLINTEEIKWIRKILKKGILTDKEEDEIYGDKRGDEVPSELTDREKVNKIIKEVRKENSDTKKEKKIRRSSFKLLEEACSGPRGKQRVLEKLEHAEKELEKTPQQTVSLTDPESRWMKNKKHQWELSYNMQIAVDHDHGIILASSITQDPTDHYQLIPQIEQIEQNLGQLPDDLCLSADNGYSTQENLEYIEENQIDAYIPSKKQATETKKGLKNVKPFSKHKFKYDPIIDAYICPNNKKLPYRKTYRYKNKIRRQYYCSDCNKCPDRVKCAGKSRVRIITDYGGVLAKRMELKMETPEAKLEFTKRKEAAEWPFGNIKENLKFNEFYTCGLVQTETEKNLLVFSHNIKRIQNHFLETKEKYERNT
jgi:transposase